MKKHSKKKNTPHLNYYYECIKRGNLGMCFNSKEYLAEGLCHARENFKDSIFELFVPTSVEKMELSYAGKNSTYWGSDSPSSKSSEFTPLRQTIVLFMAALNDEL